MSPYDHLKAQKDKIVQREKDKLTQPLHVRIERLEERLQQVEGVARGLLAQMNKVCAHYEPFKENCSICEVTQRATALLGPEKAAEGQG